MKKWLIRVKTEARELFEKEFDRYDQAISFLLSIDDVIEYHLYKLNASQRFL